MSDSLRLLATAISNYVRFQARDEEYTECMRCGRIQFNAELGCLQCERVHPYTRPDRTDQ